MYFERVSFVRVCKTIEMAIEAILRPLGRAEQDPGRLRHIAVSRVLVVDNILPQRPWESLWPVCELDESDNVCTFWIQVRHLGDIEG